MTTPPIPDGTRVLFRQYGCGCPSADVCTDPVSFSHCGQHATVVRLLGPDEVDAEVGRMYRLRFDDGVEASAFEEEVTQ